MVYSIEMDGFETRVALKDVYTNDLKPVISAITASDSPEEAMKCLQLGFGTSSSSFLLKRLTTCPWYLEHYLAKPVTQQNMTKMLNTCRRVPYLNDAATSSLASSSSSQCARRSL
jgi:CheY-like chemotaxis protein